MNGLKAEEIAYILFPRYITRNDVVIEVGANIGGATALLSDLARQVHAFEPNPQVFARLQENLSGRKNVSLHNLGAGVSNESMNFNIPSQKDTTFGSSHRIAGGEYVGEASVAVARLDQVAFAEPPSVIVLDCEGSEVEALRGAEGLFKRGSIREVIVETHTLTDGRSTDRDTIDVLGAYGFAVELRTTAPDGSPWIVAERSTALNGKASSAR